MNQNTKPQDNVPKVEKSAEDVLSEIFNTTADNLDTSAHMRVSSAIRAMNIYSDTFKSRITELEKALFRINRLANGGGNCMDHTPTIRRVSEQALSPKQ